MTKAKNTLIMIAAANMLALGVLVYAFFDLKKTNNDIGALASQEENYSRQQSMLASMDALVKDTEDEMKKIDSFFVREEAIVDFIEYIEKLAKDTGVVIKIDSVNVEDTKEKNTEQLKLKLSAEAKWDRVYRFLAILENIPNKVDLKSVSLGRPSELQSPAGKKVDPMWKLVVDMSLLKLK